LARGTGKRQEAEFAAQARGVYWRTASRPGSPEYYYWEVGEEKRQLFVEPPHPATSGSSNAWTVRGFFGLEVCETAASRADAVALAGRLAAELAESQGCATRRSYGRALKQAA